MSLKFLKEKGPQTPGEWARAVLAALLLQPMAWPVRAGEMALLPAAAPTPRVEAHLKNILFQNNVLRAQMDREARYRVFSLADPPRLVVELFDTVHMDRPYDASVDNGVLKRIRSAQFKEKPAKVSRIVLEMKKLVSYKSRRDGADIVVELESAAAQTAAAPAPAPADEEAVDGAAEADVTATAAARSNFPKAGSRRSKDLIASLPKHAVTIDFENADMREVIRVLSEMSGINMIYGSDITGFLSIHLDEVAFNQAFDTILTMQGLVAQQMGDNVLRILTPATLSADRSRAVTIYKTFNLNYARAADVQAHLASVRISPNGKITVDDRNNALVVTDTPEGLSAAERLIGELDQRPQQVMIEARMVEVTLDDKNAMGIQWEYGNRSGTLDDQSTFGQVAVKPGNTIDASRVGFITGARTIASPTLSDAVVYPNTAGERGTGVPLPAVTDVTPPAITFGFLKGGQVLGMTLSALTQKGLSKLLSAPKVITLNNQQARIQVGSKVPIASITTAQNGQTTQNTTFVDVGIILTVTPTISANNRVRLKVKPEVSTIGTVSSAGPEIFTRNAETEVLINNGDTIVIGGLIDDQMSEGIDKVPLLGDVPVLGVFFRRSNERKRRNELLVFVTPRLIQE